MTSILVVATAAVLVFLGASCRRARLDLEEQLCDCLEPRVAAAVGCDGHGAGAVGRPRPALTGIAGGRTGCGDPTGHRRRHLRVVRPG